MALAHPIFVPLYVSGTPVSVLKIVQGGSSTVAGDENGACVASVADSYQKTVFVWNGNIFMPVGHPTNSNLGWVSFNPRTGKFQFEVLRSYQDTPIPIGDRVGIIQYSFHQSGPSPRYMDHAGGAGVSLTVNEWAALGDMVLCASNGGNTIVWSYPFTSPPGSAAATVKKLCPFKGVMMGAMYTTSSGVRISQYTGGAWVNLAAYQPISDQADLQDHSAEAAFFEAGDKLWILLSYNTGSATQLQRLYEVDEVAGTITERNDLVPAGWKVAPGNNYRQVFEVVDDTGGDRLVYLIGHNGVATGWDCYEFDGVNPMTFVASGGHRLGATAGAIWDEGAHGCHVEQSFDSSPSEYATIKHRVYDLQANAAVDVDLRYEDLNDPTRHPVFPQCSEKSGVGSEGKTSLISKPAGIAVLSDLDDDFEDGVIDPILWEPVNIAMRTVSGQDYGFINVNNARVFYKLVEENGEIRSGGTSPSAVVAAYTGVGIKSRWGLNGEFVVRATLANLAALSSNSSKYYRMVFMVKEGTGRAYGILIHRNGPVLAEAFSASIDGPISVGAIGATGLLDGMVIEIARDALGNFTMTVDVGGTPEVLGAPALLPVYTGEMQAWLGAFTETTSQWTNQSSGPGFGDFNVSGAGSLGRFEGGVLHDFMWDHVLDLGVGQNIAAAIHADTD